MKGTIFRRLAGLAVLATVATVARPASAQIIGKLNVSGDVNIFQVPSGGPIGQVVVDFLNPSAPPAFSNGTVQTTSAAAQTGIFNGLGSHHAGTNVDFVLGPFSPPGPPQTPAGTNILHIGTFDFILGAFAPGTFAPYPFNVFLSGSVPTATLSVRGTLLNNGKAVGAFAGTYSTGFPEYDPALGGGGIPALISDIENGNIVPSSVAATFVVRSIPEPGTVVLMATGLVAVMGAGLRRRKTV